MYLLAPRTHTDHGKRVGGAGEGDGIEMEGEESDLRKMLRLEGDLGDTCVPRFCLLADRRERGGRERAAVFWSSTTYNKNISYCLSCTAGKVSVPAVQTSNITFIVHVEGVRSMIHDVCVVATLVCRFDSDALQSNPLRRLRPTAAPSLLIEENKAWRLVTRR